MKRFITIVFAAVLYSCNSTKTIGVLQGRVISGNVVRMQWRSLGDGKITSGNGYYTTFQAKKVGVYQFEFTGFDSLGRFGKDTIRVTVTP